MSQLTFSPAHNSGIGRKHSHRALTFIGLAAVLLLQPVYAQAVQTPTQPASSPSTPVVRQEVLVTVLTQMGRQAGVTIVADSTSSLLRVTPPLEATTPANVGKQLAVLVHQLPGAEWAKLMLPALPPGHTWKGDDVAQFADAASRLYGKGVFSSGSMFPTLVPNGRPGFSVLGQPIPDAKAAEFATDLHLQPVYVVASSAGKNAAVITDDQLSIPGGTNSGNDPSQALADIAAALSRELEDRLKALPQANPDGSQDENESE